MIKISANNIMQTITCDKISPNHLYSNSAIEYFDKDGYELTDFEKESYVYNGYSLNSFLHKDFLAYDWISIDHKDVIVDHSMMLMRCDFQGELREFITFKSKTDKKFLYFLQIKPKWGFDIDINYIKDDIIYEILHLEYDTYNYDKALSIKENLDSYFKSCDVVSISESIISMKKYWEYLHGYDQNRWKANYLGFSCSEDTRKSI